MRAAALLIDLQNDYLSSPALQPPAQEVVAASAAFLSHCREREIPVIHIWTSIDPDSDERMPHWKQQNRWICVQNTKGHETPDVLRPLPSETVLHKVYFSAFSNPDLLPLLKASNIDTLYVLGVHLHACVRATLLDAYSHGFKVVAIEDALGSDDPVHAAITRRYLEERFVPFKKTNQLQRTQALEAVAKLHDSEKSMILPIPCQDRIATLGICGETIPERVGELTIRQGVAKGRFCASKSFATGSLEKIAEKISACAEELAYTATVELGKPIKFCRLEVQRAIDFLKITASYTEDLQTKNYQRFRLRFCPLGTVAIITPWNNPILIPIGKIAPALFYGNKVIWKPSPLASRVSNKLRECLPSDLVQVISGGREEALALAASPEIDALTFSGSQGAGFALQEICVKRAIPYQGELGGNNGAIVWRDSDLQAAAQKIAGAAFGFAGQRCTANRRVIVDEACFDQFLELLKQATSELRLGDPLDETTDIGPVISIEKCRELKKLIEKTESSFVWTVQQETPQNGAYFPATIVVCDADQELVQEESFGPILVVQKAKNWEEALQLCNGVRQGLVAALFSRSEEKIEDFLRNAKAGILKINRETADADPEAPFGGWKASGVGPPEHGIADREFYTRIQTIYD